MDKNVEQVIESLKERADKGLKKYGTTTEREDLSFLDWLNHAQDEAKDFAIYLQRIKNDTTIITKDLVMALEKAMAFWKMRYDETYGDVDLDDISEEGFHYRKCMGIVNLYKSRDA